MNHTPLPARKIVVIKIGGSLIAPKDWQPQTVNEPVLQQICSDVAKVWQSQSVTLLIAVGSGNFGHAAVKKYGINTPFAVEQVQKIAQKTGMAVVQKLSQLGLPTTLLAPHKIWYEGDQNSVIKAFGNRLIPVLYGDVVQKKGEPAVIFSGETCTAMLVPILLAHGYGIDRIIQAGKETGVYDADGKTIAEITADNWGKYRTNITANTATDVTGGMLHKIEMSLAIATEHHIPTYIIDGTVQDRIYRCAIGKNVPGTRVVTQ